MSFVFNRGAYEMASFFLAGGTAPTLKAILVTPAYASIANRDHDFVSQLNSSASAAFGATAEITATSGYVRGFGGSGRIALGGATAAIDDTDDAAEIDVNDLAWSVLTTADQVAGLVLAIERTTDGDSPLIAFYNDAPFPAPVGGISAQDFLLTIPAGGIIHLLTNA